MATITLKKAPANIPYGDVADCFINYYVWQDNTKSKLITQGSLESGTSTTFTVNYGNCIKISGHTRNSIFSCTGIQWNLPGSDAGSTTSSTKDKLIQRTNRDGEISVTFDGYAEATLTKSTNKDTSTTKFFGFTDSITSGPYYYGKQITWKFGKMTVNTCTYSHCLFNNDLKFGTEITVTLGKGSNTFKVCFLNKAHTTITLSSNGNGSVDPSSKSGYEGETFDGSATADEHYHFSSWNDGNTSNPRTFKFGAVDRSYSADFAKDTHKLTVVNGTGSGTYEYGSTKPISANKEKGYLFSKWTGDYTGSSPDASITIEKDMTVTAEYTPMTWDISFALGGDKERWGSKSKQGNAPDTKKSVAYNGTVTLPKDCAYSEGHQNMKWVFNGKEYTPGNTYNATEFFDGDDTSCNAVILYTKWYPIKQWVHLWYAAGPNKTVDEKVYQYYNIDEFYAHESYWTAVDIPSTSIGDYVFFGWTNREPNKFKTNKGVYQNYNDLRKDQLPESGLPEIWTRLECPYYIKDVADRDNPNVHDKEKNPENLYGLWLVANKYVYIKGEWKKVQVMSVYNPDGESPRWVSVDEMSIMIDKKWKKEVK